MAKIQITREGYGKDLTFTMDRPQGESFLKALNKACQGLGINREEVEELVHSYFRDGSASIKTVTNAHFTLTDVEEQAPSIEISPEEFQSYQDRVARQGMCTIRFNKHVVSKVKKETPMALLIIEGKHAAWIPKSTIYNFDDSDPKAVTLYIRADFPITWMLENE